jgi:hypothetical protein
MAPWITLWFQPRHTLRKQLLQDPHHALIFLAVMAGLLNGAGWITYTWAKYPFADSLQRFNLVLASLCAGVLYSVFHLYLFGWLYSWTGSWIGGEGKFTECKCAVGWSYYPFILSGCVGFLQGIESFSPTIQTALGMIFIILSIWSTVILFLLIAEAHRFSFSKGIFTFLLSLMVLLCALFVLALGSAIYRFIVVLS